ncbi:MAG: hypothetical protein ACE5SV_07940, partial [Candidatus Nitrosomaritimum aestuariumsis]
MHRSYAVITTLLVFSFGFSSAFADEGLVNPDGLTFDHVPNHFLPKNVPVAVDPLTGQQSSISSDRQYVQVSGQIYDITNQIDSESVKVQQVTIGDQTIGIQLD